MSRPDDKTLTNDACMKMFLQRVFDGNPPKGAMDIDQILWHSKYGFVVFEFLKCETEEKTPWTASPNLYYLESYGGIGNGNKGKFVTLDRLCRLLGGKLILVDYADEEERPECANEVKVSVVKMATESKIFFSDVYKFTVEEFRDWMMEIYKECRYSDYDAFDRSIYENYSLHELGELPIIYNHESHKIEKVYEEDRDYLIAYSNDYHYWAAKEFIKRKEKNKMSQRILIIGEPGSGKSASLRNLPPEETFFIDADQKGLPWRGWREQYSVENHNYARTNDHEKVQALIDNIATKGSDIHYIVVDTLSSLMIHDEMMRAKEKNFDRWMDLATCVYNMVATAGTYRDDLTIIFIGHSQTERDDSGYNFTRMKTSGKKLDKICLESLFNVVLLAKVQDGEYVFETQANNSTTRTPMGAFEELTVPNDIVQVLDVLKEF